MAVTSYASMLTRFLAQLPVYLVWLVGAIVAVVRWRRHPRVSLLAVAGLAVLFLSSLVSTAANSMLPMMVASGALRGSFSRMATVLAVCSIVFAVIAAVGYGLLLAALFSGRAPQPAAEKRGEL